MINRDSFLFRFHCVWVFTVHGFRIRKSWKTFHKSFATKPNYIQWSIISQSAGKELATDCKTALKESMVSPFHSHKLSKMQLYFHFHASMFCSLFKFGLLIGTAGAVAKVVVLWTVPSLIILSLSYTTKGICKLQCFANT